MRMLTLVTCVFLLAPAAAAQEATPIAEVAAGYSALNSDGDTLSGWMVSASATITRFFGVAGEVGVNYFSETATYFDQTFSYSYNVLFAGVGPRFVARSPRVAAFGQFLVGVENEFETLFAIQGGGGVDVWITRTIEVRAGVDGRASYYDEERYGSWRVQTGVVLPLGTR
jgi:hypothetical protein